jgi:hypothetical protein
VAELLVETPLLDDLAIVDDRKRHRAPHRLRAKPFSWIDHRAIIAIRTALRGCWSRLDA